MYMACDFNIAKQTRTNLNTSVKEAHYHKIYLNKIQDEVYLLFLAKVSGKRGRVFEFPDHGRHSSS